MPMRRAAVTSHCAVAGAAAPPTRTTSPKPTTSMRTMLPVKWVNDRHFRPGRTWAPSRTGAGRRPPEPDRDRRAPPLHARQADGPAPALDQPPRDREPQAGSARRGGKRRIEDAREDVGGDAAAVVLHSEPAPVLRDTYRHAPGARIAGVLEQVDEDLLHFVSPGGR